MNRSKFAPKLCCSKRKWSHTWSGTTIDLSISSYENLIRMRSGYVRWIRLPIISSAGHYITKRKAAEGGWAFGPGRLSTSSTLVWAFLLYSSTLAVQVRWQFTRLEDKDCSLPEVRGERVCLGNPDFVSISWSSTLRGGDARSPVWTLVSFDWKIYSTQS